MKFPMRIYGEVQGFEEHRLQELQKRDLSPFELRDGRLEVDYEGPPMEIEMLLDDIAASLGENGQGHVDVLDHDEWEVRRYQLSPGTWDCTRVNPDHSLEGYLHLK